MMTHNCITARSVATTPNPVPPSSRASTGATTALDTNCIEYAAKYRPSRPNIRRAASVRGWRRNGGAGVGAIGVGRLASGDPHVSHQRGAIGKSSPVRLQPALS